jgi:hypothetical protein
MAIRLHKNARTTPLRVYSKLRLFSRTRQCPSSMNYSIAIVVNHGYDASIMLVSHN